VPGVQGCQEACGIVDILMRVEHVPDAAEMIAMIVLVDLHAAEVNQGLAFASGILKGGERFIPTARENCFSLYIQRIRLKAAFLSCLCQADRIENASRHAIPIRGAQDLRLARICGGVGSACR
jgi:hypothetical protein